MSFAEMSKPVRGTQTLVGQMGWVWRRPWLTALEICWRWLWGVPLILVGRLGAKQILSVLPTEATGIAAINPQNPWVAAVQLADAWARYRPLVVLDLSRLAPIAALAWIVVSGLGRSVVLKRMEPRLAMRPAAMMGLQAAWLVLLAGAGWSWLGAMQWVASTHIGSQGEPDLVGYAAWVIFLSLAFFVLWALVSWVVSIAPLLMLLEGRSAVSALGASFRLGRAFSSKLVEMNLVMGIANLALAVVAMVISAAPLPFSDELGPETMHVVYWVATIFYLVASDYFQVVRLKSSMEFWKVYRGPGPVAG